MAFNSLPLSYCTNVHPGRSVREVETGLDGYALPVSERLDAPLAAGLWLARSVVTELLETPGELVRFASAVRGRGLSCHTLNAFPFGDFHSNRVKEQVYVPDWTEAARHDYTLDCARALSALLDDGVEGSISTVPLGFKEFEHPPDFLDRCCDRLVELARSLERLRDQSGRTIRLAIEPEPFCVVETTDEALRFFERLWERADAGNAGECVREFVGLCYDVCHQAVEFEDVAGSIRQLDDAGVRINKVHITCAIHVADPQNEAARRTLAEYVEPRYLHQTTARTADGRVLRAVDLTERLALEPDGAFAEADAWRVHFHVPVDAESLGPLSTTRNELRRALSAVRELEYAPHLEVETYTWDVLPGAAPTGLVEGLTRELRATKQLLRDVARA